MGARDEAVALFREMLQAAGAIEPEQAKSSEVFMAIRGLPAPQSGGFVYRVEKELIGATARQAVQLARSVNNAMSKANLLMLIAEALPD